MKNENENNTTRHSVSVWTAVAGNRLSQAYLAVCAAVGIWCVIDQVWVSPPDASFSTIWPLLLTAPVSLLALVLPSESLVAYMAVVVLGAVVNAWLLGRLVSPFRGTQGRDGEAVRGDLMRARR